MKPQSLRPLIFCGLVALCQAIQGQAAMFTVADGDVAGLITAINTANGNGGGKGGEAGESCGGSGGGGGGGGLGGAVFNYAGTVTLINSTI